MQERLGRARAVVVRRLKGRGVFAEDLLHGPELGAVGRQSMRKNSTGPDEVVSGRCVDGSAEKKSRTHRLSCIAHKSPGTSRFITGRRPFRKKTQLAEL